MRFILDTLAACVEKHRLLVRDTRFDTRGARFDRAIQRGMKPGRSAAAYNHGLPGFFMGNLW